MPRLTMASLRSASPTNSMMPASQARPKSENTTTPFASVDSQVLPNRLSVMSRAAFSAM